MAELTTIIAGTITIAKKLHDVTKKIKDAEARNLIADLNLSLADVKMQVVDLITENADLKDQLRAKEDAQRIGDDLYLGNDVYWKRSDRDVLIAYCPACWISDKNLYPLESRSGMGDCPKCHHRYVRAYESGRPAPPTS